ncbi:hypothetical protein Pmani_034534 [Petrolisthes manimaculis]|uniref:Uncharacterized protein n=1 Tax=Petrolisthes manimaculis TaxID=1843537 RepID=A0AAE1NP58_9EUCA|nr:hypothetical protein Pmani_034534 [Petrolisthes manimaculis]
MCEVRVRGVENRRRSCEVPGRSQGFTNCKAERPATTTRISQYREELSLGRRSHPPAVNTSSANQLPLTHIALIPLSCVRDDPLLFDVLVIGVGTLRCGL